MQIRNSLLRAAFIFIPAISISQTTYLPFGGKEAWLLDRMEIKLQTNNDFNLSTVKPYMRSVYVRQAEMVDSMITAGSNPAVLTTIDQYNLDRFIANNSEYALNQKESWKSKKPWSDVFYPTKGNFLEVNQKDFYLSVNPAINQQQSFENGSDERIFVNSKGVTARGLIAKKIGFNFFLTDNQERGPQFVRDRINAVKAVPGAGFYKEFKKTGVDYFDARGSVNWNVTKYINMQFGFDKQFIGNGYRSLFLSDYSNSALFLKFNTRIWKINYTNLFMELYPSFGKSGDNLLPRKYAAMHHFSINATKWLNVGAFEAVIFGRKDHFDFSYLLPIIFLRSIEGNNGSSDNANIGFDFKANFARHFQVYGQLMLDEFKLSEVKAGNGWWANKQALQLGGKYVDAFGIKNLDLQGEVNFIRPFVYSHFDSVAGYNHYNQPLAHPMGANVREMIGIARFQPLKKLYITVKGIYWKQGLDSAGYNFGSNVLLNNNLVGQGGTRKYEYGYKIGSGISSKGLNASLAASYELKENLWIDGSAMFRTYKVASATTNTNVITLGLRWNMAKREYDY
ncbi:MAG: hypothetical protein ABIX01_20500 [Chitinophagaceae bacterium]